VGTVRTAQILPPLPIFGYLKAADQKASFRRGFLRSSAVAIALGQGGGVESAAALEKAIITDLAEELIGAAAIALGKMHATSAKDVLVAQLDRESFY